MIWFYRLLYIPGLVVALPYYLLRMWRRGGYRKDFQHRFGRGRRLPAPAQGKKRVWLQAVSVGEVLAIGPLIDALQRKGDVEIVLTTTTSTGYAEARKRYQDKVFSTGIFPLDFWLFSRTAWKRIQPDAVILTESELWPEHLHQAARRRVPTFLINARMSDTSFGRYQKVRCLAARLFRKLSHIFAASDLDQQRLIALGADANRVTCTGNIKFDVALPRPLDLPGKRALRKELGFPENDLVLLGSSTWPGEEALLLKIQQQVLNSGGNCSLLLVPRHAERGPELARLLSEQSLPWHQRSRSGAPTRTVRIHLADTTGELTRLSQAADLAFIGKSLPPNAGGQTPIEAAGLGIPIVMGPKMGNFKAVARSLVRNGAALQVENGDALSKEIIRLLEDPAARTQMSEAGRKWHARNTGSSARIAECIRVDLQDEGSSHEGLL